MIDTRTPLSRARGLGSAKEGVHHWWLQRVTAIAQMSDGSFWIGDQDVIVTIAACLETVHDREL